MMVRMDYAKHTCKDVHAYNVIVRNNEGKGTLMGK